MDRFDYWRVEATGSVDDIVNQSRLLFAQFFHGLGAAAVLDPFQNQFHNVDAGKGK